MIDYIKNNIDYVKKVFNIDDILKDYLNKTNKYKK